MTQREESQSDAYDMILRYLRNNMDDIDFEIYSDALDVLAEGCAQAAQPAQHPDERAVTVSTLSGMFQNLEGIDKEQWGYHWRKGWNDALRQAMDYAQPAQVPDGYVLVPVEPTEAMEEAAERAESRHVIADKRLTGGKDPQLSFKAAYAAMLAAAPSTKEQT